MRPMYKCINISFGLKTAYFNELRPSAAYMRRYPVPCSVQIGSPVGRLTIFWTNAGLFLLDHWEQISVEFW